MKRIAYWALHYGAEYLPWSVRSVQDAVDELHFLYSPEPSYGHRSELICPETEEELKEAAQRFCTKPLFWHRGNWSSEGIHREAILPIAAQRGADQILWVDADEVWDTDTLRVALEVSRKRPEEQVRVRFCHFWKGFNWVCLDPCMPVRIINPKGNGTWYLDPQAVPVLHFGYSLKVETMRYKWSIHGHQAEYKPGWLEKTYIPWKPGTNIEDGLHPTCACNEHGVPFWVERPTPEELKPFVHKLLHDHPYYGEALVQ